MDLRIFISLLLFIAIHFEVKCQQSTDVPINQIYQNACHNCYQKKFANSIEEALLNVNAIEIDIYDSKNLLTGKGETAKKWFVRHSYKENKALSDNCCGVAGDLDSCLSHIKQFTLSHLNHKPIFVFIDKKQGWTKGHSPKDLDSLIIKYFNDSSLFTPHDLPKKPSLWMDSIRSRVWPTEKELEGRVAFILTGGNIFCPNKTLSQYLQSDSLSEIFFVAPIVRSEKQIILPKHFKLNQENKVLILNLDYKSLKLGSKIHSMGKMSRCFNLEKINDKNEINKYKINFRAYYLFQHSYNQKD